MMFQIGQVFEESYPPEVAVWCNESGKAYIEEIEPVDGKRRFQIVAIPEPTAEEIAAQELAEAKAERAEAVSKLVVTVNGKKFDADETSQNRMARVVAGAQALGVDLEKTTQIWVLADNTIAQPTVAQLAQALKLAGEAQTALWTKPYTEE